mgnify:CR=1 FL=1
MDKDRIYGHAELALLYFKNIQPKSASTQLARWIRRDEELWEELLLAGYRKGQKVFTPLQVTILATRRLGLLNNNGCRQIFP